MIKNIIFDIGGVLFDDSLENTNKVLNKDACIIYKKAYGGLFKDCLIGKESISMHLKSLENDIDYDDIKYLFDNYEKSLPLIVENFEYIKQLKSKGYNVYLLSNIEKNTLDYIKKKINLDKYFSGGVYSYIEQMKKPNKEIYELILNKYKLNPDETIFFDDKETNLIEPRKLGIRSYLFKNIDDIKNNLDIKKGE